MRPLILAGSTLVLGLLLAADLCRADCPGAPVHGTALKLSWDDCISDVSNNRNFSCTTDAGQNDFVAYLSESPELVDLSSAHVSITIRSAYASFPPWWEFQDPGACRRTALQVYASLPGPSCADYWGTVGSTYGFFTYESTIYSRQKRIVAEVGIDPSQAHAFPAAANLYLLTVRIKNAGTSQCAGCEMSACFGFETVFLDQVTGTDHFLSDGPAISQLFWQNPYGDSCDSCQQGIIACPIENVTWGQLKSIYR